MDLRDDGNRLVVTSSPSKLVRGGAIFFGAMFAVFVLIVSVSLLSGKQAGAVDCDRARGTCEVRRGANVRSAPIAQIAAARLVHERERRNSSASDQGALLLRDGTELELGEPAFHDDTRAAYRAAVTGLQGFLADAAAPRFHAEYVSNDADWFFLIFFALVSPLWAWGLGRLGSGRQLELDRAARSVQVQVRGILRRGPPQNFSFDQVRGLSATGANWAGISLLTDSGRVLVAIVPRTANGKAQAKQLLDALSAALGAPVDATDAFRRAWALSSPAPT